MNLAMQAKISLAAIALVVVSCFSPVYTFAQNDAALQRLGNAVVNSAAQGRAETARARLAAAETRLRAATVAFERVGNDPAVRATAQTELAAAQAEVNAARADAASANSNAGSVATTIASSNQPPATDNECSLWSPSTWITCVTKLVAQILGSLIIGLIAGPIITLAGLIFDYSLYFSIIKFPSLLQSLGADGSNSQSSIYATWVIVRNLFNIIIVFQLLKIAIFKILTPVLNKSPGDLKRLLMSIIIFTLFVNFSFFFTKALIDVSNITALQFYSGLGGSNANANNFVQGNIGIAITEALGISTKNIFNYSSPANATTTLGVGTRSGTTISANSFEGSITGVIILFCLLMLASFVLIQGAAIFIGRSVILIILIVFSPLMFARNIIGFVNSWSEKWWDMLLEQLFVAPLYLGMLFLTLKIAGDGKTYGLLTQLNDNGLRSVGGYFGSIAIMIIQGAIMAGLFISAVKLAKDFGGAAAKKSSAWGAKAYGATVGGAGGYALRKTAGRFANGFDKNGKWKDAAAAGGVRGAIAGGVLSVADRGKNATFDLRNSSTLANLNKTSGKFGLGLDSTGTGAKGGFVTERAATDKKRTDTINRRTARLNQDTYGLSGDEKKRVEAQNRDRVELATVVRSIDGYETDEQFNKLLRSTDNLEGVELASTEDYNKKLTEARARAQSELGRTVSGVSQVRSGATGTKQSSGLAREAAEELKKKNKKAREDSAKKKAKEDAEKIFKEIAEEHERVFDGAVAGRTDIESEINARIATLETELAPLSGRADLSETETAQKKELDVKKRKLVASRSRVSGWIKNRDEGVWRDSGGTGTPSTPPAPPAAT